MRIALLYILFYLGLIGCASVIKEPSIEDTISEYNLSETFGEAIVVGKASGTSSFTFVGLGLFALGALSFAFIARNAGLKLMLSGAIAGAVPFVVQSAYFSIIVSLALVAVLIIGVYKLWLRVKQPTESPAQSCEQTETPKNAEEEQKP